MSSTVDERFPVPSRGQQETSDTPNMDPPSYDSLEPPPYPGDQDSDKSWQRPPSIQPYSSSHQAYEAPASCQIQPPTTQQPSLSYGQPTVPVVVVNADCSVPSIPAAIPAGETYTTQMCLACVVMCCCNCLFGLIAYILASMAQSSSAVDRVRAHRFGRASLKVSIAGIFVAILLGFFVYGGCRRGDCWRRATSASTCSGFNIDGLCYNSRREVRTDIDCRFSFATCCHSGESLFRDGYCYSLNAAPSGIIFNPPTEKNDYDYLKLLDGLLTTQSARGIVLRPVERNYYDYLKQWKRQSTTRPPRGFKPTVSQFTTRQILAETRAQSSACQYEKFIQAYVDCEDAECREQLLIRVLNMSTCVYKD